MKQLLATILLACLAAPAVAGESTALTIYSTARPGAVPAELYRPLPQSGYRPAQPGETSPATPWSSRSATSSCRAGAASCASSTSRR